MTGKYLDCFLNYIAPILLGLFLATIISKKVLHKDEDFSLLKIGLKLIKVICVTISGPLLCAAVYSYSPNKSIFMLMLFGFISFLVSVFLCVIVERKNSKIDQKQKAIGIEYFLLLLSLLIPSTFLYLMFLFIISNFDLP
jgi:ABC-type anion transport system duplicated permease subunit